MGFFSLREKILVEGIMPERALLRLRRAGIDVYNVKKTQKNQILFSVKKKDSEKVFAIYPNVCYNSNGYSPYVARKVGAEGLARLLSRGKDRIGLVLGALLFCGCTLFSDTLVLGVEFTDTDVYAREAYAALEEYGIRPFSGYERGNEDLICAKLLSLDGVEFCSVKKSGCRVLVEIRLASFQEPSKKNGDMTAAHTGKLLSLTVLRGTALKKTGEEVRVGEPLVGGYFETVEGEKRTVAPIARAYIACTYEAEVAAADGETAFAECYLSLGLTEKDEITGTSIVQNGETFHVKIDYTAVETFNF